MAVNLKAPDFLLPVQGVRLGVTEAGIRKSGRRDLLLIELAAVARVAGVFTRNAFCAAPVQICREVLASGAPVRALLVNAGNANAATGEGGLADARQAMAAVGAALGCPGSAVLPFSTGVIGQRLPMQRMLDAIPRAAQDLRPEGWMQAMSAIMTTDTVPKGASRQVQTSQGQVTVTGIAKGVGMIRPDMATMLAFVGTDARLANTSLNALLRNVVNRTFNCVTVDGDTSTNDSCLLFATGQVGDTDIDEQHADYALVESAVLEVCTVLAQAIVRDGEGATKFITIEVGGARDEAEAQLVAYSVAQSPLVKTALFASDANWGRIIMAIGKAGVEQLDPAQVSVALDELPLVERGEPHPDYREALGAAVVAKDEFSIRIQLGRGSAGIRIWTCDLSYDYVKINAEYRT
jgi:glutamate N-acetyltransferase / amino-acid N-acetyltransferase